MVYGKGDARYWKQPGKLLADKRSRFLSCKIQHAGRRESFPLKTANKSTAAAKAAKIFSDVVSQGWEEALIKTQEPSTASGGDRWELNRGERTPVWCQASDIGHVC